MPTKKTPARRPALGRSTESYPIASATLLIGRNKGKLRKENRDDAFCRTVPGKITQDVLDETVRLARVGALRRRTDNREAETLAVRKANEAFAASRMQQKGWYAGDPEPSNAYVFHHDSDLPGEESVETFRLNMQRLAEDVSSVLCQDSVIVTFDTPGERGTRFVSTATDPKYPSTPADAVRDREIRSEAQNALTRRRKR